MVILGNWQRPLREIDPEQIFKLASEGKNKTQIAKILKCGQSWLSQKMGNSLTLTNAYNNGRQQFKGENHA